MEKSSGFEPIAARDARVLILGSLPGGKSIAAQQYYAHRQNSFWRIMNDAAGISGSYAERCEGLRRHRIAVWDVLAESVRPGSLDAAIRIDSAVANDFGAFFAAQTSLELIAFNGRKAQQLFRRFVTDANHDAIDKVSLPSTSPAYAAMPYSGKLERWRAALQPYIAGMRRNST